MKNNQCAFVVRVRTDRSFGAIVETGLNLSGLRPTSWTLADRDVAVLDVYVGSRSEGMAQLVRVRALVASWAEGERWTISLRRLARQDWAESWKRFFKVERVSRRIVVKPPWKRVADRPGRVVVEIEPGMSFGTGQHATTRSCLRLLDEIAGKTDVPVKACTRSPRTARPPSLPPKRLRTPCSGGSAALRTAGATAIPVGTKPGSLLDLGCGSGILAIAGAKLGFGPVVAVDNDPTAVRIAKENALRNRVLRRISFRVADLAAMRSSARFDVVVANVLAGVLIEHAGKVTRLLRPKPRSRLILSGILTSQYTRVKTAYEAIGLNEHRRICDGKWTSGCFRWGGSRSL